MPELAFGSLTVPITHVTHTGLWSNTKRETTNWTNVMSMHDVNVSKNWLYRRRVYLIHCRIVSVFRDTSVYQFVPLYLCLLVLLQQTLVVAYVKSSRTPRGFIITNRKGTSHPVDVKMTYSTLMTRIYDMSNVHRVHLAVSTFVPRAIRRIGLDRILTVFASHLFSNVR